MSDRFALALLIAACLGTVIWPGDVPFINDEAQLITRALDANAAHRLAPIGLLGTYGLQYGPLPVWVYQGFLAITHALVMISFLHTAMIAAATAAALWWLARSLRLCLWFAAIPLLSPYFWEYARMLWDNTHLIPLGAIAVAGYAAHLGTGSRVGLRLTLACLIGLLLVHLMALALVIPLVAHMLFVRWRQVRADWMALGAILTVALVLAWPDWTYLVGTWQDAGSPTAGHPRGWWFPLTGGRLLGADRLSYLFGATATAAPGLSTVAMISRISHAFVLGGIGLAMANLWMARARPWTARDHLIAIALAALACQTLFDGLTGKFHHPHYHNGTWIAFVILSWTAVDWAARQGPLVRHAVIAATAVLAAALISSVVMLAMRLHSNGGTRDTYGPTLANQLEVARGLSEFPPGTAVASEIWLYTEFPHTLDTLRRLHPPGAETAPAGGPVKVRYSSSDPAQGRISLAIMR